MVAARPHVSANFALTLDLRATTASHAPSGFGSRTDKRRLRGLRSECDALLVGLGTAVTDRMGMGISDPALCARRIAEGRPAQPIRAIVSRSGNIPSDLSALARPDCGPLIIFTTPTMPAEVRRMLEGRAEVVIADAIDPAEVLRHLGECHAARRVLCEGGPTLLRSLLEANLVDELHLTVCPLVFGGRMAPGLTGIPAGFLPEEIRLDIVEAVPSSAEESAPGEFYLRALVRKV